jgi:hypothetical protein
VQDARDNDILEEECLSLDDQELTKVDGQQTANLGKSFTRGPLHTYIMHSTSHDSIQTAIYAFGRVVKLGNRIVITPHSKEFTSFNCNQPLAFEAFEKQFRKYNFDWTNISKHPNYWQSSVQDDNNINLEVQAEYCRKLLNVSAGHFLEYDANAKDNCQIDVDGRLVSLKYLMRNTMCKTFLFSSPMLRSSWNNLLALPYSAWGILPATSSTFGAIYIATC